MSSIAVESEGTWEECGLVDCHLMFKRFKEGHKRYSLGDKLGICPLSFQKKQIENGTQNKAGDVDMSPFVHHKGLDAKPESDSL